jgi:hypothetical protein
MRRLPLMPAAYTVSQPSANVPSRPRRDLQIVASPKSGWLPCNMAADKYRNYQKTLNFSDRADSGTRSATAG